MPAATAKKSAAKTAARTPTYPGLVIPVTCELPPELAAEIAAYHADCHDFERQLVELNKGRHELLAAAMDTTIRDLVSGGAALNEQKGDLEQSLTALLWRRFELLPKLLPPAQDAVAATRVAHEKAIAGEIESFEAMGAGLRAMPAYQVNPRAAEQQLRKRVSDEPVCMAALGELNEAQGALRTLEGMVAVVPGQRACSLTWPPAEGTLAEVARLTGIA